MADKKPGRGERLKKRLYVVTCDCEGYIAVVANSSKGAMTMGRGWLRGEHMCGCEFTDFRCNWNKAYDEKQLEDMNIGVVDDWIVGLKKGIYGYVTESECPECLYDSRDVSLVDGKAMCSDCEDKYHSDVNLVNPVVEGEQ